MILYKEGYDRGKRERAQRKLEIKIEEYPKRPAPKFNTPKDREKHIKTCEKVIRASVEYKDYIKFLKENLDMDRCLILRNITRTNKFGKHYKIELHHEPFTLFDIVETVINRRLAYAESIDALKVADEVMDLHYAGKIGLVPLAITMHELVHNGRIFIPLQYIYHRYNEFFEEYQKYMTQSLIDKIEAKVNLSLQSDGVISDALKVEFVYLDVEGMQLPKVPDEWKNALASDIGH